MMQISWAPLSTFEYQDDSAGWKITIGFSKAYFCQFFTTFLQEISKQLLKEKYEDAPYVVLADIISTLLL